MGVMGTISVVKNVFNSGELSPKVYARSDIDKHKGGCKTLLNFVPLPQGGVQRRPGFQFITSAKSNNANVRLVPFQFSQTQAYILETGNGYMRVFKDGGQVLDANNNAYEFATPWTENDLGNIQYSQSYDKLFVTHQNYFPREITRTAHNNWTVGNISFANAPSEWSANNGYPRTCTFYQDRLCFASSTLFPSRLWMSATGSYNNMTTGTNDSDGMVLNLLSGTSDVIQWLASSDALIVGADSGMWTIAAATGSNAALSPTNKKADKVSYFGAAPVMPARLGDIIIHPGYPASKMREMAYSFENDGYKSGELSVLADHLFELTTITEVAYQQNPFEIVWCLRSDGVLLALTYMQEHKVVAWSRHTSGTVKSIATIPGQYETEFWAAINRNVGNNTATYIERLSGFYSKTFNNSDFMDSHIHATAPGNFTSMPVAHLNGEVVQYVAGGTIGQTTVANNNITVPSTTSARAGLSYTSDLETMPVAPELKSGDVTFAAKRITEIQVRCRNSAGGSYGPDSDTLTALLGSNNFSNGHIVNKSRREGSNSSKTEKTVFIRQTDPLPLNIDAIGMEIEVE
jgi:hypothetical protein